MKKVLLLALSLLALSAAAQTTPHHTFPWDGVNREYSVYTPDNLDTAQPRGMLFVLLGLGNSVDTVDQVFDMVDFCNRTGWVCVFPQALDCQLDFGFFTADLGACWNSGISATAYGMTMPLNPDVDDKGFLLALLQQLRPQYNVPDDSVFFSGISMGAFMTHRMLIEEGQHIAAAVPISGTIANTLEDSIPHHGHHPRVMHIHGTADSIVSWQGNFYYRAMHLSVPHIGMSVDDCVDYWVSYNQCQTVPTVDSLDDRHDDGLRFVRHRYAGGIDSSEFVLMEVIGGDHVWYADPRHYDVDYLTEIYKFCSGRELTYPSVGIATVEDAPAMSLYPNPSAGRTTLSVSGLQGPLQVELFDPQGRLLLSCGSSALADGTLQLPTEQLPRGLYLLRVTASGQTRVLKLVKE